MPDSTDVVVTQQQLKPTDTTLTTRLSQQPDQGRGTAEYSASEAASLATISP